MIARGWRVLRTGVGFAALGATGLYLTAAATLWFRWRFRQGDQRELRFQGHANASFRRYMALVSGLGLTRVRVDGVERLREPGVLVVANHPTLFDAVAILAHMPNGACVTKRENASNPFLRGVIESAGYVVGSRAMVDSCVERLESGHSLLLFPEGTRSPEGSLGPFQRGAARVALASGRAMLPVHVRCDPPTLMRGQPWYEVPDRPFELTIRVGEPISVAEHVRAVEAGESRSRVARRLTAELREIFAKRLDGRD